MAQQIPDYAEPCKENRPQAMYWKVKILPPPMEDRVLPYSKVSSIPSVLLVCACSPMFCVQ